MNYYLFVFFLSIFACTSAVDLSCEFKTKTDWWAIDNIYFCEQDSDLVETIFDLEITRLNGAHLNRYSNSAVKGFRIENKKCRYFPENLSNFFPNLEFLAIWEAELSKIHQSDLQPFTNLRVLSFFGNNLEILNRNLFKYNTKLEYIGLGRNKIKHVQGRIFNHLKNLHSLHFDGNVCASRQVGGNRHEVWDLVEEIEEKCSN